MGENRPEVTVGQPYVDPNESDLDYQILMAVNGGGDLYLKNAQAKTGRSNAEVISHFDCLADSGAFTFHPGDSRIVQLSELGYAKLKEYYPGYQEPEEELPE